MNDNPHYLITDEGVMCFWRSGDLTLCSLSVDFGRCWSPSRVATQQDLENLFVKLQPALAC